LCDQPHLYSNFIAEFRAADFQVLTARSLAQAKAVLLTRSVKAIVLCHDSARDDRPLAPPLKRMTPQVPVFLLTDRAQALPAEVDSIWLSDLRDEVVTRGMAVFFRHIFNLRQPVLRPSLVPEGVGSFFVGVTANGSA
jgi:hypothetical protein